MNPAASKHLTTAAAFIAVAESGDAKREAYMNAADEIIAAQKDDPTLSFAEIDRRLGKSKRKGGYSGDIVRWRTSSRCTTTSAPWEGTGREKAGSHARTVLSDPEQRRQVIDDLGADHRVEIAATLLADPEVVQGVLARPAPARSEIKQAISRENTDRRDRARVHREQRERAEALPLPAYMSTMVVKMNEWAAGLAALRDDLDGLPDGRGRELLLEAARELAGQAQAWVDRLHPRPTFEVIEGHAEPATMKGGGRR